MNRLLSCVDFCTKDQIGFQLKCWPRITFVACYIPPEDSPYFRLDAIATLAAILNSEPDMSFVVLGDLNCRYGELRNRFLENCQSPWNYYDEPDIQPNRNAKQLISMLIPLIMINGLDTGNSVFSGAKTYRQGPIWKSTLDHVYASESMVPYIEDFSVRNDVLLPSDHATVFFSVKPECRSVGIDRDEIVVRAEQLGSHNLPPQPICQKQYRWEQTNSARLDNAFAELPPPIIDEQDIGVTVSHINDSISVLCQQCRKDTNRDEDSPACSRSWSELLELNDSKKIWNAIDWSGRIGGVKNTINGQPSDDSFKIHFEALLNPMDSELPDPTYTGSIYANH